MKVACMRMANSLQVGDKVVDDTDIVEVTHVFLYEKSVVVYFGDEHVTYLNTDYVPIYLEAK